MDFSHSFTLFVKSTPPPCSGNGDTQIQLFQFTARVRASAQLLNIVVRKITQHKKKWRRTLFLCVVI